MDRRDSAPVRRCDSRTAKWQESAAAFADVFPPSGLVASGSPVCRKECDWFGPIIVQVQIAFVCLTHQEGVSALAIAARALVMHTVIFKNNHTISLRNEIQTGCSLVAPSPAAPECQQISTPQSYCQARSRLRPKQPVDRLR